MSELQGPETIWKVCRSLRAVENEYYFLLLLQRLIYSLQTRLKCILKGRIDHSSPLCTAHRIWLDSFTYFPFNHKLFLLKWACVYHFLKSINYLWVPCNVHDHLSACKSFFSVETSFGTRAHTSSLPPLLFFFYFYYISKNSKKMRRYVGQDLASSSSQ